MAAAHVREACGIPGTSVAHRVPVPRQAGDEGGAARRRRPVRAVDRRARRRRGRARSPTQVGYPLILKPRDARRRVGHVRASTTTRELDDALVACGVDAGRSVAVEEFIEGHEGFYDTLAIGGEVVHEFVVALLPERARGDAHALDLAAVRRHQPHRRAPATTRCKAMGAKVIDAARHRDLGDAHGVVLRAEGPQVLARSAAARRACARGTSTTSRNDMDLYREWAMAVVHGRPSQTPSRRFAAGHHRAAPRRDGRIAGYEGARRRSQRAFGECIIDAHLPPAGHADAAGRGRLHGERLDAHEAPRLRRAAPRCSTSSARR